MTDRTPWDEFFLQMAELTATMSTCLRHKQGAVLVRDRWAFSTGFNGVASGCRHCDELGCARAEFPSGERLDLCRAIHAEQNALILAARHGASTDGATLYTTCTPCLTCAMMIVNAGIARVVSREFYPNQRFCALVGHSVSWEVMEAK